MNKQRNPKLDECDYRGPNEPSYKPIGLRWLYWSDLGAAKPDGDFLRNREPQVEEVQEWLESQGYAVTITKVKGDPDCPCTQCGCL